jgi:hypothetical protein
LAAAIIALNVAFGLVFAKNGVGWLPVLGACLGTIGFFLMRGVRMRLVLLAGTFLWLANNILSGSIGGTALEATIATVNIVTMTRIFLSRGEKHETKQIPELTEAAATHGPDGRI